MGDVDQNNADEKELLKRALTRALGRRVTQREFDSCMQTVDPFRVDGRVDTAKWANHAASLVRAQTGK